MAEAEEGKVKKVWEEGEVAAVNGEEAKVHWSRYALAVGKRRLNILYYVKSEESIARFFR